MESGTKYESSDAHNSIELNAELPELLISESRNDDHSARMRANSLHITSTSGETFLILSSVDDGHVLLSTNSGLKLEGHNSGRIELRHDGSIEVQDKQSRFQLTNGKLQLFDANDNMTFEVDAQTGDVKLKGNILRL